MVEIILSFVAVFSLQFFLCKKAKSKRLHFLPVCIFLVLACGLTVPAHLVTGWDALAYIVFAIVAWYISAVCGVALVAYYALNKISKKKKEREKMELWDAFHEDGTMAGKDLVRGEPVPDGLYHKVSEVLIRHTDGDYLLMQRDFNKPSNPGKFEASAGGSVIKGESELECIKREILEETGIDTDDITPIGEYRSKGTLWYSFLAVTDCEKDKITLQEGETVAYKWLNEQEFIEFVNSPEIIEGQKKRCHGYFQKMGYVK